MDRRKAREHIVKAIYQQDLLKLENCDEYIGKIKKAGGQKDYIREVTGKWLEHSDEIDKKIEQYIVGWKMDRMPRLDLAILREAATEILYLDDVPGSVSINEAVELAKIYGTEKAPKFINAILGKILREEK